MAEQNQNKNLQNSITNGHSSDPENENEITKEEEYEVLDSQLDELNSALDYLEQKNDNINERLRELLQSNRDIRQELQNENNMEVETSEKKS